MIEKINLSSSATACFGILVFRACVLSLGYYGPCKGTNEYMLHYHLGFHKIEDDDNGTSNTTSVLFEKL